MKEAPCRASRSVDSSVPLKTGSPVWLVKSAMITVIGATGAAGRVKRQSANDTAASTITATARDTVIHFRDVGSAIILNRGVTMPSGPARLRDFMLICGFGIVGDERALADAVPPSVLSRASRSCTSSAAV